jgi:hypothetical protein
MKNAMKRFFLIFIVCINLAPCLGQDFKKFILDKYEEWFSIQDTIYSSGVFGFEYRIKDITLGKSKEDFFNSIKSIDIVLDCPSLTTVQINFDSDTLFVPVGFHIKHFEQEDDCCHCEDTIIDERLKHLNNDNEQIDWLFLMDLIYDSDGQSIDIEQTESYHYLINPATVRDKDGYVNVRAERSLSSKITNTIKVGEVIYYTPSVKSSWWRVYKDHGNKFLGYVHKSRIQTYEFCSPEVKRRIEHAMH